MRTRHVPPSGPAITHSIIVGYHPRPGWLQLYNDLEALRVSAIGHADSCREQRSVAEAQQLFGSDQPLVFRRETMTLHGMTEQ
ncbi:hypothetical protein AN917_13160 [Mycobacteroides immunogenum]|uniref:Uncharacterized protein n=1 Tax=Mycobacteroides immunogenum TaxID=83262 RepID=A0ABR5LRF3_9MYCO|nr:hypothetical protein AN912_14970 [Mycobacteroides immunogenum]KPG51052.1 hypothetical protein AN917_13160 [Mycobacteroides immunogenum]